MSLDTNVCQSLIIKCSAGRPRILLPCQISLWVWNPAIIVWNPEVMSALIVCQITWEVTWQSNLKK